MDIISIIPFYVAISVLLVFIIYQFYLSRKFKGDYRDKYYYFICCLINLIPCILYLMTCIKILLSNEFSLEIFYIEWIFTTPLIIITLCRFKYLSLYVYLFLTAIDIVMIISGYISYISKDHSIIYIGFICGCICYSTLFSILLIHILRKSYKHHTVQFRIFRAIVSCIMLLWCIYPIFHILYMLEKISINTCIIGFIILDILSKCIFTNLLTGSCEINYYNDSFIGNFTKKIFKIHPLERRISIDDGASFEITSIKKINNNVSNINIKQSINELEIIGIDSPVYDEKQEKQGEQGEQQKQRQQLSQEKEQEKEQKEDKELYMQTITPYTNTYDKYPTDKYEMVSSITSQYSFVNKTYISNLDSINETE